VIKKFAAKKKRGLVEKKFRHALRDSKGKKKKGTILIWKAILAGPKGAAPSLVHSE